MASTRDIRRRIKSVKNTRQITKAMELVAASKMKKAQQAGPGRPAVRQPHGRHAGGAGARVDESNHPFLVQREVEDARHPAGHDRQGPVRPAQLQPLQAGGRDQDAGEVLRRSGARGPSSSPGPSATWSPTSRSTTASRSPRSVRLGVHDQAVPRGKIDTIEVIYPRFKNTLVQEPVVRPSSRSTA
jgi:F-type H+-transporting ATPase subunit gamma